MRTKPSTATSNNTLDTLIPQYADNKAQLDKLDKVVKAENKEIKDMMSELPEKSYSAGGYKATRTVSTRESMDEARLLEVAKRHHLDSVIKTKEYVDMDELENYLYNHEISTELATDLDDCRSVKEVVTLKVTKEK